MTTGALWLGIAVFVVTQILAVHRVAKELGSDSVGFVRETAFGTFAVVAAAVVVAWLIGAIGTMGSPPGLLRTLVAGLVLIAVIAAWRSDRVS